MTFGRVTPLFIGLWAGLAVYYAMTDRPGLVAWFTAVVVAAFIHGQQRS